MGSWLWRIQPQAWGNFLSIQTVKAVYNLLSREETGEVKVLPRR